MTNREWLESLGDKELAEILTTPSRCEMCANNRWTCKALSCVKGTQEWLSQEHLEDIELCPLHCENCNRKMKVVMATGGKVFVGNPESMNYDQYVEVCPRTLCFDHASEAISAWNRMVTGK